MDPQAERAGVDGPLAVGGWSVTSGIRARLAISVLIREASWDLSWGATRTLRSLRGEWIVISRVVIYRKLKRIDLVTYLCHQSWLTFSVTHSFRTPELSVFGLKWWKDGWYIRKWFAILCEWDQNTGKNWVVIAESIDNDLNHLKN